MKTTQPPEHLKGAWGIYKILNLKNNRCYIGRSTDLYQRWNNHLYKLRKGKHKNLSLQGDYDKYGEDNFKFRVIEYVTSFDRTELAIRELEHIYRYKESERYNVPSEREAEIYEIVKLMISQNIAFSLFTKLEADESNQVDIVIYYKHDYDRIKRVVDVHIWNDQNKPTVETRRKQCERLEIEFLPVEPNDGWYTRQELINCAGNKRRRSNERKSENYPRTRRYFGVARK